MAALYRACEHIRTAHARTSKLHAGTHGLSAYGMSLPAGAAAACGGARARAGFTMRPLLIELAFSGDLFLGEAFPLVLVFTPIAACMSVLRDTLKSWCADALCKGMGKPALAHAHAGAGMTCCNVCSHADKQICSLHHFGKRSPGASAAAQRTFKELAAEPFVVVGACLSFVHGVELSLQNIPHHSANEQAACAGPGPKARRHALRGDTCAHSRCSGVFNATAICIGQQMHNLSTWVAGLAQCAPAGRGTKSVLGASKGGVNMHGRNDCQWAQAVQLCNRADSTCQQPCQPAHWPLRTNLRSLWNAPQVHATQHKGPQYSEAVSQYCNALVCACAARSGWSRNVKRCLENRPSRDSKDV